MYKHILIPLDLTHPQSCMKAVKTAIEIAEKFAATVHVMSVIPDSGMSIVSQYFSAQAIEKIVQETNDSLQKFVEKHFPESLNVHALVTNGNVYESIIMTAKELNVDLIVMSAHRPELRDYLLGPNAARVVRHSDRSVLVVRE